MLKFTLCDFYNSVSDLNLHSLQNVCIVSVNFLCQVYPQIKKTHSGLGNVMVLVLYWFKFSENSP